LFHLGRGAGPDCATAVCSASAGAHLNGAFELHFLIYRLGAGALMLSISGKLRVRSAADPLVLQ